MMSRRDDPREYRETLLSCLEAISDLLIPNKTLGDVNRDNFSTLLGFLLDELRDTEARLR
jgi:hypothetical protein